MNKETPPKRIWDILLDAFGKIDKLIGFLTAIVAYLTFVKDYHILSYIFVIISYTVFTLSFAKIISEKISRFLILVPSNNLKQRFAYSKSQRSWSIIALVLLTLTTILWLGINLYNDFTKNKTASESTVTVYSPTPSTIDNVESNKSLPRFASEKIDFYGCCYGQSKSNRNLVWTIIGKKQTIKIGSELLDINPNPDIELSTLLLVPTDVVWTKIALVVDNILPPDRLDNISIINPAGGRGGSSVPVLGFSNIVLPSSPSTLSLFPETISLPYRLNSGDVYNIGIPLSATYSGEYNIHLEAEFTLFSGETMTVTSPQTPFGVFNINQ